VSDRAQIVLMGVAGFGIAIVFLTFFDPGWWWGFGIALLAGFANLVGYVEKAERR